MFRAKERASGATGMPPWVRHEHDQRYLFAANFAEGAVVVDVACGDGMGTSVYAARGARSVHAFDLSPVAVAATNRRALPGVTAAVADGRALPLEDDSADLVVTLETLEHIPEHERFLAEIGRVLRPGGTVVCSTPNRLVYSPGVKRDEKPWNPFHVKEFDLDELRKSLERRFVCLEFFGQNPSRRAASRALGKLGSLLPLHLAVRLRQVAKLRMFLRDSPERHAVVPFDPSRPPEIFVAVAKKQPR